MRSARLKQITASDESATHLSLDMLMACRQGARHPIPLPIKKVRTHLVGGHLSRFRGRGMDFDEVRQYQAGDDVRSIDWRVTARTGEVHTKIYREERERPVFLVIDFSDSMFFASRSQFKSILAAKLAANRLWSAIDSGNRVAALLFDAESSLEIKPSSRRKNALQLLNAVSSRHNQRLDTIYHGKDYHFSAADNSLANELEKLRYLARPGSLVYIFSDFLQMNAAANRHLAHVARHNDVHAIALWDPLEAELPPSGSYAIADGTEQIRLDTSDKGIRRAYRLQFEERIRALEAEFVGNQCRFNAVGVHETLDWHRPENVS